MIIICSDRVGCSAHQNKGTCDNRRSIRLAEIEARVLAALKSYLLAPDLVAKAVEAYRIERARLAKERAKQRRNAERDLAAIDRKITGVIAMGEKGGDPRALALRLNELEAERRALLAQMPGKETDTIALHPNAAERYRQKVADVHAALTKGDEASREAITLVRELIERITVEPTPPDQPPKLELFGNLAALMREPRENRDSVPMVAGAHSGLCRNVPARARRSSERPGCPRLRARAARAP